MYWQTQDIMRYRRMTLWEQIVYNFSKPYWLLLRGLATWGFLTTPDACYLRLRDFTPFFWRTMIKRELEKQYRNIDWLNELPLSIKDQIRAEAVESFCDWVLQAGARN